MRFCFVKQWKQPIQNQIKVQKNYGECLICLDDMYDGLWATSCGHLFHKKCILAWLSIRKICPTCSYNIED